MADQEVIINDSSLNEIANAIRRKNGLVRTYKPREMAPAIRSFKYALPTSHEYRVTVNQSAHQTITVRRYLNNDWKDYTKSFTVSEPYFILDIQIESDAGWTAGTLNQQSTLNLSKDIVISASPAIYEGDEPPWETYYVTYNYNNWVNIPEVLTTPNNEEGGDAVSVDPRYINAKKVRVFPAHVMNQDLATSKGGCSAFKRVEELDVSGLNVSGRADLVGFVSHCDNLRKVDISHLDTKDATSFVELLYASSQLRSFGDISHWNTSNLLNCSSMFCGLQYIQSLDLSGWTTPLLLTCSNMFDGMSWCRVIDISNWSTSQIENLFTLPSYLEYLIMDKEEIKFPNKIFSNNSRTTYLVPDNMVNLYKEHPNWQSRANQIKGISNYTISRANGQVWVRPNPY